VNPAFFIAPFTAIDLAYSAAFKAYLHNAVANVQSTIAGPLLALVTLWIIVQGILVMRGDIDTRRGLTKIITVAIVVGLVTSSSLYTTYVQDLFETAIPSMVTKLGGGTHIPSQFIPLQLDIIFRGGQAAFQSVASEIPPGDNLDSLSFQGAQFLFYFTLWSIFGVYCTVSIMTSVLVAIGPLFIIGFLFEATRGITTQWLGQLINYAILLLLITIVAQVVVGVIVTFMTGVFLITIAKGTDAGQIIGLYELDLFILSGNALVVALPAIAAQIGGGVAAQGVQMGMSTLRNLAGSVSQITQFNVGMFR
jgi:type IV secretion system protein VirB6